MEIELHPAVSMLPETFNVLIARADMLIESQNSHLNLQLYKALYISGNYSRILSHLNHNFTKLEIRRAFTCFQLMTILKENHHSFMIVEHDPLLYRHLLAILDLKSNKIYAHVKNGKRWREFLAFLSTDASWLNKKCNLNFKNASLYLDHLIEVGLMEASGGGGSI